jgi:hypothetical protein
MKKALVVAVLIAALILGIVAYAFAAPQTATSTVGVTVGVASKLTLTVTGPATLSWIGLMPGDSASQGYSLNVASNRDGVISAAWSADPVAAGYDLGSTLQAAPLAGRGFVKGALNPFADTISFLADYDTPQVDAGDLFTLTYTATQS